MNSDRTQKVMVILLAGMAIGLSSFANIAKPGHADFSSLEDGGEVVRQDVEIQSLTQALESADPATKIKKETTIVEDVDRQVVITEPKIVNAEWTANVTATVTTKLGHLEGTYTVPVSANNKEQFQRRLKNASENAQNLAEEDLKRKEDRRDARKEKQAEIENCEKTASGRKIDDKNFDAKYKCLTDKAAHMTGEKKEIYLKEVVEKYVRAQQKLAYQTLNQPLDPNDPMGIKYTQARNDLVRIATALGSGKLNLGTQFTADMQNGILAANARLAPFQARAEKDWIMSQFIQSSMNMPPAQRAQAEVQMRNAMNQVDSRWISAENSARMTLSSTAKTGSGNADVMSVINTSVAALQTDMRNTIASNSNLSQYSKYLNPSYGSNISGNLLASDPFNTNSIFGGASTAASLFSVGGVNGVNTFDSSQFYNFATTPTTVTSATTPSFQPPATPVAARATLTRTR